MDEELDKNQERKMCFQMLDDEFLMTQREHLVTFVKNIMHSARNRAIAFLADAGYEIKIPESQMKNIEAAMTAVYLMQWLAKDDHAGDNLHHYLREEYKETDVDYEQTFYSEDYKYASKKSKEWEVIDQHIARQAQAENRSYRKEPEIENKRQSEYAKQQNYAKLWKIELDAKGKLLILHLIFDRKKMFQSTNKREKKNFVLEGYRKYYELYRALLPEKEEDCRNTARNRKYVVTALMLHEMEYTYRFHAVATLAIKQQQRAKQREVPYQTLRNSEEYKKIYFFLCGRFARSEIDEFIRVVNDEGNERIFEYISYDILHYEQDIDNLLDNGESAFDTFKKILMLERLMILLACKVRLPSSMPSWTDNDYAEARQFFETEYPIFQIYHQMMNENHKMHLEEMEPSVCEDCCTAIRTFFEQGTETFHQYAYNPDAPTREDHRQCVKEFRKNHSKHTSDNP